MDLIFTTYKPGAVKIDLGKCSQLKDMESIQMLRPLCEGCPRDKTLGRFGASKRMSRHVLWSSPNISHQLNLTKTQESTWMGIFAGIHNLQSQAGKRRRCQRVANPAEIGTHGLRLIRQREERQISIEDCTLAALIEGQSSKLPPKFSFSDLTVSEYYLWQLRSQSFKNSITVQQIQRAHTE